jgi:hypothetical protein
MAQLDALMTFAGMTTKLDRYPHISSGPTRLRRRKPLRFQALRW